MLSNAQWERFACKVAEGELIGAAYEYAGYKTKGNVSEVNGCRLLKRPEVAARVAEIKAAAAEQTGVTIESLIKLGLDIIADARADKDFSAASATYERLAKISGNWVDRSENKSTISRLVSDRPQKPMDEQEWLEQHTQSGRLN